MNRPGSCWPVTSTATSRSSSIGSTISTAAMAELEGRGWTPGHTLEIPQGPVCSFTTPGGQRLAIYQLSRPGVEEASFVGRRDF